MQNTVTDSILKTSVSLLFYPQISRDEALLAVAVFPAIRELDICSNPLITQRISNSNVSLSFSFFSSPVSSVTSLMSPAGDPPSLTQYLQHRLGITVKSNSQPVTDLPLRQSDHPTRKVIILQSSLDLRWFIETNSFFIFPFRRVSFEERTSSSSGR